MSPWGLWVSFSLTACQFGQTVSGNQATERHRLHVTLGKAASLCAPASFRLEGVGSG